MRYTKMALLTFGAGLMLGLIVVVTEFDPLDRAASGLMALGLFGIPVGMIVDWRLATRSARRPAKKRAGNAGRRALPTPPRRPPRPRKPAPPKR